MFSIYYINIYGSIKMEVCNNCEFEIPVEGITMSGALRLSRIK